MLHLRHLDEHGLAFMMELLHLSVAGADIPAKFGTRPGSLLPPHLTALPGNEDIGAALPPVHRGGTGYMHLPAELQTKALHRLGPAHPFLLGWFLASNRVSSLAEQYIAIVMNILNMFDTVSHRLFIEMIHHSRLRHNLVRWLVAYLRCRKASFLYQQYHSSSRQLQAWSHRDPSSSQPSSTSLCRTAQFPIKT